MLVFLQLFNITCDSAVRQLRRWLVVTLNAPLLATVLLLPLHHSSGTACRRKCGQPHPSGTACRRKCGQPHPSGTACRRKCGQPHHWQCSGDAWSFNSSSALLVQGIPHDWYFSVKVKVKGKGWALVTAPQVDTATTEALRYMAHTEQCHTYLPYTFLAVAGTHLPTPKGWRVE